MRLVRVGVEVSPRECALPALARFKRSDENFTEPAMTQDDMPAPAVVDEAAPVIEYAPPAPTRPAAPEPATPKPARKLAAVSPDPFAVGVRVLKMAPAWLLVLTVCCSGLVVLLGWMRPAGDAAAGKPPTRNDARAAKAAKAPAAAPEAVQPPQAPARPAQPAAQTPAAPAPQPATPPAAAQAAKPEQPAPAPKAEEKSPAPADGAKAKFTAQVGSFNTQSEANARVSALRAAGFESRAVAAELPGRGTWYRVQVGRFADREGAAKAAAALRAKGAAAAAIVVPIQN
ncbi:MAG TPA: SPOR domain-containing protein [Pyrinomonadaceae bacterium]|jgi:hypothetical protein